MKLDRKKMISIALAFCLTGSSISLNTGCQKQNDNQKEAGKSTASVTEIDEMTKGKEENISVEETEINLDSTVMAVGNEKISFREVMFYVYYLQKQYEDGFGKDLWDYQMDEEKTIEDYVKEQIVSEITEIKIISAEAEKAGYTLSVEEENEARTKAVNFLKSVSAEEQKEYGFTQEMIENIYKEHALTQKTYDIVCGQVNTSISDEEAKQTTICVLAVLTQGEDRNGKMVSMDEKEKETAKKRAQKFLKEGKKSENFIAYAESNSDLKTVEYTFGKDNIPEEFGETALTLTTGEYSNVVEGTNGYYIIYCISDFDKEKTTAKKEEMIEAEQIKLFQDTYTKWSADYETVVSKTLMNQIHMGE